MIVLNVIYRCKPGMRDAFLDAVRAEGIDSACRAEDGNIRYDYFIPACESDELLLLEKWRDPEALETHGKQAHYLRLGELKKKFVTETMIEKFEG